MSTKNKLLDFTFIQSKEIASHFHLNPELFYCISGNLSVQTDLTTYQLHAGDFILINSNKKHTCLADSEFLGARFIFDYTTLSANINNQQIMFWCNTVVDKNDNYGNLRHLLDRILQRYFETKNKDDLLIQALSYQALHLLVQHFLVKSSNLVITENNSEDKLRIQQIQNYIQENFQSAISLTDLSQQLHLSISYLSKYIKKHFGLTFMEYLNNVRIFHAIDEMLNSEKNLTHIALDNGFPSFSAFTREFSRVHNMAPGEYRKNMASTSAPSNDITPLDSINHDVFHKIFKETKKQDVLLPKERWEFNVDVNNHVPHNSNFSKAVNIGEAALLLQSDVQKKLLQLKKACGITYVRIWNLLIPDRFSMENQIYDFGKIGPALDFLVQNGFTPYLELAYTPYNQNIDISTESLPYPMINREDFQKLIRIMCVYFINHYDPNILSTWYFSFSYDEDRHRNNVDQYYDYFDILSATIKEFLPTAMVGGGSFTLGYQTYILYDYFKKWKMRLIQPDFIAFHSYQLISVVDDDKVYYKKSTDGHYMENQIHIIKQIMEQTQFHPSKIFIDEWNFTTSNHNYINDSCSQAAYILKTIINMSDQVDFMCYWHGLDAENENYKYNNILSGDSGLITTDNIYKPSYYAFIFTHQLLPFLIHKDPYCILTTDKYDKYVFACHNFKRLASNYVITDDDSITIDNIEHFIEDTDPLQIDLHMDNLKNGTYQIKTYYLNKDNGDALNLWRSIDCKRVLTADEISYIQSKARPTMEIHTVEVTNHTLNFQPTLQAQEIRIMEIQYIYQ